MASRIAKHGSHIFLSVLVLLLPVVVWGSIRAFSVFENDIYQWLPKGFQEARDYQWFKENFGVDEMVVVSWPNCTVTDERLAKFADILREKRNGQGQLLFDRVVTGPEMLERIENSVRSESLARQRSRGLFINADETLTCCLCYPSEAGIKRRSDLVDYIGEVGKEVTGLPLENLHMGGPTIDGAAIDQESKASLKNYLWMTVVVVMMLAWMRTRNWALSLLILAISLYCAGMGMAVLSFTGGTMNLTLIMLPTLTFILAVSGCVHMTNYFLKAYQVDPETATTSAIQYGGYPVILSSLTTAVGMGSLASSQIQPIRMFGVYSAVAVMVSLPVILLGLPIILGVLTRRTRWIFNTEKTESGYQTQSPLMMWLSSRILNWHLVITAVCVAVVAVVGWGVTFLQATVNVQNRFDESTKIIQDYSWLEANLGPLVPMEVVLAIPVEHPLSYWERTELINLLERNIRTSDYVSASYSAATFQPKLPNRGVERQAIKVGWDRHRMDLERARLVTTARDQELWRISVRVKALDKTDYAVLLDTINVGVQDFLQQVNSQLGEPAETPITAVLTGGVPMMYKAQHQVLSDLMISFLTAFILISLVMIVVLKNVVAGLIAMLPNVFPPLMVFGSMGWLGLPIEIGSVMTASVALGIAVDDTIHFLAWFRRGAGQNLDKRHAILYAFKNCAKSMVDTTLICGLGTAPFMMSVFMPTVRFARLMLILLLVGLVGDLVLLPAMLQGPLGKFFCRHLGKPHRGPRGANSLADASSSPGVETIRA